MEPVVRSRFRAMQAARRGKGHVKLDYKVVVVGRKHCKLEPTYEVVKDPSQASSAAELAS